jgi:ribulose 1,5-bisphosphate synthetase/thiazole synthase
LSTFPAIFPAPSPEDLIIREDPDVLGGKYVGGVVTNWTLVTLHHDTQSCMDPNVIEAQVVVSSCGHDGPMGAHSVKRLSKLGMVPDVPGMAALDMNSVSTICCPIELNIHNVLFVRTHAPCCWTGCCGCSKSRACVPDQHLANKAINIIDHILTHAAPAHVACPPAG